MKAEEPVLSGAKGRGLNQPSSFCVVGTPSSQGTPV